MNRMHLRGFGSMSPDRQKAIASLGGKAAHKAGAHEWTSDEARLAGQKGGRTTAQRRKEATA